MAPRPPVASRLDLGSGGGDFFSEDDLPEWLRALSTDAAPDRSGAASGDYGLPATGPDGSAPVAVSVPTVTSVWVTGHDGPQQSSSASVFAAVANALEERPVVMSPEPVYEPIVASNAARVVTTPTIDETMPRKEWSRFRLYMLAAVLIAFLLLLMFTTQQ
jgi:hypothetical protein